MNRRLLISWFALSSLISAPAVGQSLHDDIWDSVLETLLADEELTSDALGELSLMYESMHEDPLNINQATREQLLRLPFLTDEQIEDIHAYIYIHGPMLSLGELELTGSLDWNTRRMLREFVYAGPPVTEKERLDICRILREGRSELTGRLDIPLYLRDGFRYHSPQELERYPNRAYKGSRLAHNLRYSFSWHDRIKFGITSDKDAGEPFGGENRLGYDFFSPYLFVRDLGLVRELAVGNFKFEAGHGLLLGGGLSMGKGTTLTSMSRPRQGLRPHSSTQEYGFLSGAGVTLGRDRWSLTMLAARTSLDATLKGDSLISSFKEDGYHRTPLEWSRKDNIRLTTVGTSVRYGYRGLDLGLNLISERLPLSYKGTDRYTGASLYGSLRRARFALTGELSVVNSRVALITSGTLRPGRGWTVNAVMRHYSPDYTALHCNAMAESGVENETGLLTAVSHSAGRVKVSGYVDLFSHPKARYGASEPSRGMDVRMETDCRIGSRDELYVTARFKAKQKDCKYTGQLEYCLTGRYRLRWTRRCCSGAELKTQLYFVRYDFIAEPISDGWALMHTYSRSLLSERLRVSVTGAVFRTDSYDSRVSVYENGLRYGYNFMTLQGKGARVSATVRYDFPKGLQLSLKAGSLYYLDRDEIGSSQQRIPACHKEDISLQFISKF